MKLQELFLTQEDKVKKAELKLKGLERSIEDGDTPEIHNASYTIHGHHWGDLRDLGFASEEEEPGTSPTHVSKRWVYNGPGPIKLITKYAKVEKDKPVERGTKERIMQPGETTDWVEVDVS